MKKKIVVVAMCVSFLVSAPIAWAAITGSKHDFSAAAWNSTGEICIVCHTPHNADTTITEAPLWNHAVTATASFTLYSNPATLDAILGQPSGASKLCLSCHDGTVQLDDFGNNTPIGGTITGTANLGIDLSDEHPISFTYNTALATTDGGLKDPNTALSGLGSTIDADLLFSGQMQCATCHDVHDAAGLGAGGMLLVKANTGSDLCLTCHNK